MVENCDTCHADYDITPANALIRIYLGYPSANHLSAKCQNGHVERLFANNASLVSIIGQIKKLRIYVAEDPDADLRADSDASWARVRAIQAAANGEPIVERFISPRELKLIENQCRMFRHLLESGDMP